MGVEEVVIGSSKREAILQARAQTGRLELKPYTQDTPQRKRAFEGETGTRAPPDGYAERKVNVVQSGAKSF
jgi:hypothetical protein